MKTIDEYKKILLEKYLESGDPDIEERYFHSLSVGKKAVELIQRFNLNVDCKKAEIAGILHDYAKFEKMDKYQAIVEEYQLDKKILTKSPKILHALLGPYIIQKELGITDQEILEAIYYHPFGSTMMSLLSEVIFLADFVEDSRVEPYFKKAKDLSKINFRQAILAKIERMLELRPNDEEIKKIYNKYSEE